MLYSQVTGFEMKADLDDSERLNALKDELEGKVVLLVLDDTWSTDDMQFAKLLDPSTESKTLVSTRVREHVNVGTLINLELPDPNDSVKILLAAAGIIAGDDASVSNEDLKSLAPKEAYDIVEFCKRLPLAIGIAGRLLKSRSIGKDWSGITALLKKDFKESGQMQQTRAMENTVIRTSLNSISGSDKDQIVEMFLLFALVPEDTQAPLQILEMMLEASGRYGSDGSKLPSRIQIRRWIKVLINRSLILGTVDRPQLHVSKGVNFKNVR